MRPVLTAFAALLPRRLSALAWLLAVCLLGAGTAQAASAAFGGAPVAGCTLAGTVYTCASLDLSGEYDAVTIASGYTVNVASSVQFRYNQKLAMSGSARLITSGDLHIGNIAPSNISVTGGAFEAGGKFTIGNQNQAITADITAGSMQLGSGSQLSITGTITSSGPVTIASHAVINGPVSGTDITTNSPVRLTGDVTATGKFILASGSTLTGKLTARNADLLPANSVVTGDIQITNNLTLGSATTVRGDIEASIVTLYSSEAIVHGNATVDRIILYWHGRITEYIHCRQATNTGDCSCVDNQSGYAYNTLPGPKCAPTAPPASSLDHFRVIHDGQASTCAPENVTVIACANAACTEPHSSSGATITMLPGGTPIQLGASPATVQVARTTPGVAALRLNHNGATITPECRNTATNTNSCEMHFSGGVTLDVSVPDHHAGETANIVIQARKYDEATQSCIAAFQNSEQPLAYSCSHVQPTNGKLLNVKGTQLQCTPAANASIATRFDGSGRADVPVSYPDVGKLGLRARIDDADGDTTFIVAPHHFVLSGYPVEPSFTRAGQDFKVTVKAVNKQGSVTSNFHTPAISDASNTRLDVACSAQGAAGTVTASHAGFASGAGEFTAQWSEVGKLDLLAALSGFMGSSLSVTGRTAGSANCSAVGPFIPDHYRVDLTVAERSLNRKFYYAGEPVPVVISARNVQGAITQNYDAAHGLSEAVALAAFDKNGTVQDPAGGTLDGASVPATAFSLGQAEARPAYRPAGTTPMVPVVARLRARNGAAQANPAAANAVASSLAAHELAQPLIRTGRLRIGNQFGRTGAPLDIEVRAEYWSPNGSWLLNADDNLTRIGGDAIALTPHAAAGASLAPPVPNPVSELALANGQAKLSLGSPTAGWIDIGVNLGTSPGPNLACLPNQPSTAGAARPWLRALDGCKDPAGRATFGIFAPENRRIIHVREVFH